MRESKFSKVMHICTIIPIHIGIKIVKFQFVLFPTQNLIILRLIAQYLSSRRQLWVAL